MSNKAQQRPNVCKAIYTALTSRREWLPESDGKTQASKKVIIKPGAESSALIEIRLIGSIHKQAETRKEKYLGEASVLEKSKAQVKNKFWCAFQKHLLLSIIKKQLGSLGQFAPGRSDAAQGSGEPRTLSAAPLHGNRFWGHPRSAASHVPQHTVQRFAVIQRSITQPSAHPRASRLLHARPTVLLMVGPPVLATAKGPEPASSWATTRCSHREFSLVPATAVFKIKGCSVELVRATMP